MDHIFHKKFTFGISPFKYLKFEDLEVILKEFSPFISSVYASPPINNSDFHSRSQIIDSIRENPKLESYNFSRQLDVLKKFDIKFTLAINSGSLDTINLNIASVIKKFIDYFEYIPEEVVTLSKFGDDIKNNFPDMTVVYSYNNAFTSSKQIDNIPNSFDRVVVGNSLIHKLSDIEKVKERGFDVEYLLNNGCIEGCSFCRNEKNKCTEELFDKKLKTQDVKDLYADASVFPSELHDHLSKLGFIDLFKISSRPSTKSYLYNVLDGYINNKNAMKHSSELFRWGRLLSFKDYHDYIFQNMDYIMDRKNKINWR